MELQFNTSANSSNISSLFHNPQSAYSLQSTTANWIKLIMTVVAIGLNAGVVVYHIIRPKQITPFTIYLLALYIANIVFFFTAWPLTLIREWIGKWTMGRSTCIFNLYLGKVITVVPVPLHTLIAINRWWAIQHPISYRNRHNKVTATCMCVAAVGWSHLFPMAGLVVEVLYYYRPESNPDCRMFYGVMLGWSRAENIVDRHIPILLITVIYAILARKRWYSKKVGKPNGGAVIANQVTANSPANALYRSTPGRSQASKDRVKPFLVLTLTSVSIVVCWLPLEICFLMWFFNARPSTIVFETCAYLYAVQSLFDPLVYIFCLRRNRKSSPPESS